MQRIPEITFKLRPGVRVSLTAEAGDLDAGDIVMAGRVIFMYGKIRQKDEENETP